MRAEADASLSMITVRVLYPDHECRRFCHPPSIGFLSNGVHAPIIGKFDQVSVRSFRFCSGQMVLLLYL